MNKKDKKVAKKHRKSIQRRKERIKEAKAMSKKSVKENAAS